MLNMRHFKRILDFYNYLYSKYGPQNWWPCEGEKYGNDEIAIGAILTQNTSWKNVEKAIQRLRERGLLSLKSISCADLETIKEAIKSSGFYNQKAERLKLFAEYIICKHKSLRNFFEQNKSVLDLRQELLSIKGIGKETADSILLYAGFKPIFVVDKYTLRLFKLYGIIDDEKFDYEAIRLLVESEIKDVNMLQEFHALIVREGKNLNKKFANQKQTNFG